MKQHFTYRMAASFIVSPGLVFCTSILLNASGPQLIVYGVLFTIFLLHIAKEKTSKRRLQRATGYAIWALYIMYTAVLILSLTIIPFSAYHLWIKLLADGMPRGTISFEFVMAIGLFLSFAGNLIIKRRYVCSVLFIFFTLSFILTVFYQGLLTLILFLILFAALVTNIALSPASEHVSKKTLRHGVSILFISVFITAVPLSFIPPSSGIPIINNTFYPFIRSAITTVYPDYPLLYNVPGYGYSFRNKAMGNTPSLSKQPIFRVKAEKAGPLYIRTKISDIYNGKEWKISSELLKEHNLDIFFSQLTGDRNPSNRIEITLLLDFYSTLPHTLQTNHIQLIARPAPKTAKGTKATGFFLIEPLLFEDKLVLYESNTSYTEKTENNIKSKNKGKYLQLPEGISYRIKHLAETYTHSAKSVQEKVNQIKSKLHERCGYTLETKAPPPRQDFLDYFLFSQKKGYCVHFATAMVLLCRLNGIPARYTEGFLIDINKENTPKTISGLTSHAWAEAYIPNKGWQTVEATPPFIDINGDGTASEHFLRQLNQQEYYRVMEITGKEAIHKPEQKKPKAPLAVIFIIVGVFLIAGIGLYTFRLNHKKRKKPLLQGISFASRFLVSKGNRHLSRSNRHFNRTLRRMVQLGNKHGIPSPETTGWKNWGSRMICRYPKKAKHIKRIVYLVLETFYGYRPVQKRDRRFVHKVYTRLR